MRTTVIPDLKTERSDVGQPLPSALRIFPVLFFGSILGVAGIAGYSYFQMQIAEQKESQARTAEAGVQGEIARVAKEEEGINKEVKEANEVKDWLAGTNQLQSLVTTICSSINADSTITQLTLARQDELSSQVKMSLQLNSLKGAQQVDQIRTALAGALGYRSFQEDINSKGGKSELNFDCTWIKTDSPTTVGK